MRENIRGRAAHITAGLPTPQAAFGAAARLGFAEVLTRGPLPGLGRYYGQGLRPRPGGARPSPFGESCLYAGAGWCVPANFRP